MAEDKKTLEDLKEVTVAAPAEVAVEEAVPAEPKIDE